MVSVVAFVHGIPGAYGVSFPGFPRLHRRR
jgi:hypothetical protein